MSSPPTILIFTYSEHGQSNVVLATSYELALSGVNVCIASFASLGARVSRLQELIARHAPSSSGKPTGSVTFRECRGVTSHEEAIIKRGVTSVEHPHGVSGALKGYSMLDAVFLPWSLAEYLAIVESCKDIIATTKPNLVVSEILFIAALDACKLVDQTFMVILPNSIKEVALIAQPRLAALWKYPALSSGFPFPLRWWQIPFNVYLNVRLAIKLATLANGKEIQRSRRSLGFTTIYGKPPSPGVKCICPALFETDLPLAVIPEEVLLCGPIVLPFDPLEAADPALKKWLDNGPTVVINRGSYVTLDEKFAREMTAAFRMLLDYHARVGASGLQVLWKAKPSGDIQPVIDEIIGKEIRQGKVKVLPWLDAEPVSILQHPNVVCTVHHGGANSFHEGIWSGLPHVVLPVWFDTYQYASLAEFLNVGIFGNKSCAPSVRAEELGEALVKATGYTEEAAKLRLSARRLKELCRAKGNGRQLSAEAILEEAGIRR